VYLRALDRSVAERVNAIDVTGLNQLSNHTLNRFRRIPIREVVFVHEEIYRIADFKADPAAESSKV
jgi:hypothetical protein